MRFKKRKVVFDRRTELEINKIVKNRLAIFFEERDSKLQTNPAKSGVKRPYAHRILFSGAPSEQKNIAFHLFSRYGPNSQIPTNNH